MPTIPWLRSFEIGHDGIDSEHRGLVTGANSIEAELTAGRLESANAQCVALRERLHRHFEHEEKLLHGAGFARAREHVHGHEAARVEVDGIIAQCRENCRVGLTMGCTTRWCIAILHHVLIADLAFKSHLQDRSIARRT